MSLESIKLIAPICNSTVYCKTPRILFKLNDGDGLLVIYITITNNKGIFNYTSTRNPELFSALAFKAYDNVAFYSNDIDVGENKVAIRIYDNNSFSHEESFVFNYQESPLAINNELELITAARIKLLIDMTNNTLKAYGRQTVDINIPISNESKIYRNYFSTLNNALYDLNDFINTNYHGLNRIKTKDIIGVIPIYKKIYTNILNYILDM